MEKCCAADLQGKIRLTDVTRTQNPPEDEREMIQGTLLGVSGQVGMPNGFLNIERIAFHVLNSDVTSSDEIIDVTLSPTIEELNKMGDE
jgi:hypothetical protein